MSSPAAINLRRELLEREKKVWEAWKSGDKHTLLSLLDDRYLMVMEQGITDQDKSSFVEGMLGGDMQLKSYTLDESSVNVRELGPGVAVIAYKARPEMEQAGKTISADYFFTTTFVKKGDTWVGAVGSASRNDAAV
jgi:hypothetical protein